MRDWYCPLRFPLARSGFPRTPNAAVRPRAKSRSLVWYNTWRRGGKPAGSCLPCNQRGWRSGLARSMILHAWNLRRFVPTHSTEPSLTCSLCSIQKSPSSTSTLFVSQIATSDSLTPNTVGCGNRDREVRGTTRREGERARCRSFVQSANSLREKNYCLDLVPLRGPVSEAEETSLMAGVRYESWHSEGVDSSARIPTEVEWDLGRGSADESLIIYSV